MSACETVEFAVTADKRLDRLEAQLAVVLRRGFNLLTTPVLNKARTLDPDARTTVYAVSELLDQLAEQANNGAVQSDLQRRAATVVGQLAEVGMLDVDGEIRAATEGVAPSVAAGLVNPTRIAQEDALLYEAAAQTLVHEHLQAGADQISATLIRGLEEGITDKDLGERLHRLGLTRLRAHADTWARTETTRWYTLGRVRMAEGAGDAVWGYQYVVILDGRTTEICRGYAGKRVSKEAIAEFPPFHWNCRTTVRAIMAEWVTGRKPDVDPLGADVKPAEGWGGDPRATIRRAMGSTL